MPVYAATQLGEQLGSYAFYWVLLVGFLTLFATQMTVFEALVRNFTDAAYGTSARFRKLPKPARITWWSHVVFTLNVLFFGFFFVNFVGMQALGAPLLKV